MTENKSHHWAKIEAFWAILYPYRLGFILGVLSVSLTVILVLSGVRSENRGYSKFSVRETAVSTPAASFKIDSPPEPSPIPKTSLGLTSSIEPRPRRIDINTASLNVLVSLPGIGPVIAQRVIDFREKTGPFKSVEELIKVKGIGRKTLEKVRPFVVVN